MKWAFIYCGIGCSADLHHTELTYRDGNRNLHVYGVSSIDEGCALAKRLVDEGFLLLELCGGFGEEGCRKVIAATNNKVLVGYIAYLPENEDRRALLPQ